MSLLNTRMAKIGLAVLILLALAVLLLAAGGPPKTLWRSLVGPRLIIPEKVLLEDFQRPLDLELSEKLVQFEETGFSQFIDRNILKPYIDDVRTQTLLASSVELRPDQFPDRRDLFRLVEDCARILNLPRPRVFIANYPGVNAYAMNLTDPVIVLTSGLVRRFSDPAELRFIIGHELGHIRARHVKWKVILYTVVESIRSIRFLPDSLALLPFLPLFKWAREAEMSADNAGLICCQHLEKAEQALVRLALNIEREYIGRINVEAFLDQREPQDLSKFSELMIYWRQMLQEHPFIADRIRQLREYSRSRSYLHLWE